MCLVPKSNKQGEGELIRNCYVQYTILIQIDRTGIINVIRTKRFDYNNYYQIDGMESSCFGRLVLPIFRKIHLESLILCMIEHGTFGRIYYTNIEQISQSFQPNVLCMLIKLFFFTRKLICSPKNSNFPIKTRRTTKPDNSLQFHRYISANSRYV